MLFPVPTLTDRQAMEWQLVDNQVQGLGPRCPSLISQQGICGVAACQVLWFSRMRFAGALLVLQNFLGWQVVEKRVQGSAPDAAACAAGLTGMVRATEERILTSLQAAITAFFGQVGTQALPDSLAELMSVERQSFQKKMPHMPQHAREILPYAKSFAGQMSDPDMGHEQLFVDD